MNLPLSHCHWQGNDAGGVIPAPSRAEVLHASYAGWILGVIEVDLALLDDTRERVNITLPRRVLARIDAKAAELGETRSGYIARMAVG